MPERDSIQIVRKITVPVHDNTYVLNINVVDAHMMARLPVTCSQELD